MPQNGGNVCALEEMDKLKSISDKLDLMEIDLWHACGDVQRSRGQHRPIVASSLFLMVAFALLQGFGGALQNTAPSHARFDKSTSTHVRLAAQNTANIGDCCIRCRCGSEFGAARV